MKILKNTLYDLKKIILPIYLYGLIIGIVAQFTINNYASKFGMLGVKLTSFIGTPIHELSHALMAILFGHKIKRIELFNFNLSGEMGHVLHSYDPTNIYQQIGNFFIGTAPILIGAIIVILMYRFMLKDEYIESLRKTEAYSIKNLKVFIKHKSYKKIGFWIFIVLALNISLHMSLSFADLKNSVIGLAFITIMLLMINLITLNKFQNWKDRLFDSISSMLNYVLSISLILAAFNMLISFIVFIL